MNVNKTIVRLPPAKDIKKRLIEAERTIADLAAQIGHPRETVSKAIHHHRFPKVRAKVRRALAAL